AERRADGRARDPRPDPGGETAADDEPGRQRRHDHRARLLLQHVRDERTDLVGRLADRPDHLARGRLRSSWRATHLNARATFAITYPAAKAPPSARSGASRTKVPNSSLSDDSRLSVCPTPRRTRSSILS